MFQSNDSGAGAPPVSHDDAPQFETIRISMTGSMAGLRKMVSTLHRLNFAEPNDWSKPQPKDQEWVTVLFKKARVG
ncbi:MAG: hypothetical protein F6J97_14475 [Leptolyngbya sp. SIO4C1]|nr:hypothetical protein [Leptolyngbya sp. SIO4C1]